MTTNDDHLSGLFHKSIKEKDQTIGLKRAEIKRLRSERETLQRKRERCIMAFCKRDLEVTSLRDIPGIIDSIYEAHLRELDAIESEKKTLLENNNGLKQLLEIEHQEKVKLTKDKLELEQDIHDLTLQTEFYDEEPCTSSNFFSRLFCWRSRR